jgi:integrase
MNHETQTKKPQFHLLPTDILQTISISGASLWTDPQWQLDNQTPGLSDCQSKIRWDVNLPDGTSLLDPQWADLLDSLRRFTWSLLVDPREGKSFKNTSMGMHSHMICHLVRWMAGNGYQRICELDNDASWEYVEHVCDLAAGDDDGEPTVSVVWQKLHIVTLLHKQSLALADAGILPMPEPPFDGRSPFDVAKEVAVRVVGRIPPLPDAVALATMTAAERMVGTPAEDVIKLQDIYLAAYQNGGPGTHLGPGNSLPCRAHAARLAVAPFIFSTLPNETTPWHAPIDTQPRRGKGEKNCVLDIRELINDIRNACVIVLQSHVGQRISEVVGLKAGIDAETRLPSCIILRTSRTGLNTVFYLKGLVSKIHSKEMEWVIGARPVGSSYLPPPVRALTVLERLYRPWREMGELDDLIVSFTASQGLPKVKQSIGRPYSGKICIGQQDFLRRYVDFGVLGNDPEVEGYRDGRGLRTHQWRKTFALWVIRTDPRMLPHLSQHFKHLSLAMTEQGYIGNDPELIEAMDAVRQQLTVRLFFEAATGQKAFAGHMAELVEEHRATLANLVTGKEDVDARKSVGQWVVENDLRIWFAEHGNCLLALRPEAARCHQIGGTGHWRNGRPNFEIREPSVCVGCECFLIDGGHAEFWRQRYQGNQRAVENAERIGRSGEFYVARQRARQAAAILRALGQPLPEVNNVA